MVGDIYVTTNSANPSSAYLGTTWSKIEGRLLLGTSGEGASKQTGGSMSKTIQQDNLPNIKLKVDTFSLTMQPHKHKISRDYSGSSSMAGFASNDGSKFGWTDAYIQAAGGGNTGTASPNTSALGSGQALDITPSYYTTHMWLRTS